MSENPNAIRSRLEASERLDYLPVSLVAEVVYCPRNFYYRLVEQWEDVVSAEMVRGKLEDEKRQERETLTRETGRQVRSVMVSSERLGLIAVVDAVEEDESAKEWLRPIEYKTGSLPPEETARVIETELHSVSLDGRSSTPQIGGNEVALRRHLGLPPTATSDRERERSTLSVTSSSPSTVNCQPFTEWVQLCAEAMVLEEHLGRRIDKGYVYYTASKTRREVVFTDALREKVKEAIALAWHILDEGVVPDPVADARCPGCSFFAMCQPHEVKFLEGKGPPPPQRIIPQDTLARTLYVDEQGASVHKRGGKIVVEKRAESKNDKVTGQQEAGEPPTPNTRHSSPDEERVKLLEVPAIGIDQLVLVGNVQISTQTLKFLLRSNVEIVYLSTHGRFEGRFVPEYHKNVHLRLKQYDLHSDAARCLALSRQFVFGKLSNMRTLLLRYGRSLNDKALTEAAREVESALRQVGKAADTATLMGLEGQGSRAYFRVFGRLIRRKELGFDFEKRTRRPPQDAVNALLGFAYALLLADVIAGCSAAGLDPYIGFFHSPRYGRPALALDLMEEFRSIVADSVVLTLINKGMVEPRHFEEKMGGVFLNEAGREAFYRAYSQRKHEQITHPVFKYKLPYHRIFELQARFLAKVVTGDLEEYVPFAVR